MMKDLPEIRDGRTAERDSEIRLFATPLNKRKWDLLLFLLSNKTVVKIKNKISISELNCSLRNGYRRLRLGLRRRRRLRRANLTYPEGAYITGGADAAPIQFQILHRLRQ